MKNWSNQTKIIVAIIIVVVLILVAYQMKWFGNKNTLFAMGGRIPSPSPAPMPHPSDRPGSIVIYPNSDCQSISAKIHEIKSRGLSYALAHKNEISYLLNEYRKNGCKMDIGVKNQSACDAWIYCDVVNDKEGCHRLWNECFGNSK